MTQENLKSLTDLMAEFDRLPRTRHAPDFEDKGEESCISVPVVRDFFQKKFIEISKYEDALIWCSGSKDFNIGGVAREGWEKICIPLLKDK